jgi:uncharacterized HAD superfamily protein
VLLGIDIDGVVADFDTMAKNWIQEAFGYPHVPSDQWNFFLNYPDGKMVKRSFWANVENAHLMLDCEPIPGAVESIQRLWDDGFDIQFVTHRGENLAEDTEEWLASLDLPTTVHYVEDKWTVGADVYLDDKPENVADILANEADAYLMAQPWNEHAQEHLPTVKSWAEFEWLLTVQWDAA